MEYSAAGLYLRGELGVWRVSVPPPTGLTAGA